MDRARSFGIIWLAAAAIVAYPAHAQVVDPSADPPDPGYTVGEPLEDPGSAGVHISFELPDELFMAGPIPITVAIRNVLSQVVAYARAVNHPDHQDALVASLEFSAPGEFQAAWDRRNSAGREVPSGVYYFEVVAGDHAVHKRYELRRPR